MKPRTTLGASWVRARRLFPFRQEAVLLHLFNPCLTLSQEEALNTAPLKGHTTPPIVELREAWHEYPG